MLILFLKKIILSFNNHTSIVKEGVYFMEIQAISNQAFGAGATGSREKGSKRRENIDKVLSLSDNDLRRLAYMKARVDTNDRKQRNVIRAAWMSVPLVAAVSDAVLSRGNSVKVLGKEIKGTAARALTGAKGFTKWAGALAVVGAVANGSVLLKEKSQKLRQFANEHPFTDLLGGIVTAYAAIKGTEAGVPKLVKALPLDFNAIGEKVAKIADKVNNNKTLGKVAKAYVKTVDNMPPVWKGLGTIGTAFATTIVGTAAMLHSLNHTARLNHKALENYTDMKMAQGLLAQRRNDELKSLQVQS